MNTLRFAVLSVAAGWLSLCSAADAPKLEPWIHTYYWDQFAVSPETPTSPDGRYHLKSVSKNGEVELFYSPTLEQREVVVVKPMPKRLRKGERSPTIVVKSFDASKQSAILRESKIK